LPNAYLTAVLSWWRIDWITPREKKKCSPTLLRKSRRMK
jgi:hypothetical protein